MFIYKRWEKFCKKLNENGLNSVTASSLLDSDMAKSFLILKHDVETNPIKALELAKIENRYHHRGSYYVQGYLLENEKNFSVLKEIQSLGHEVTYHHDVMDSNHGDLDKAAAEFDYYIKLFENKGFMVRTVCQHGNPIVERVGYRSNRDFFRQDDIKKAFPKVHDIMVDYKNEIKTDYYYFSDAGQKLNLIYDPINNDIIDTSDKDIKVSGLGEVFDYIKDKSTIVSIHPHRWSKNYFQYIIHRFIFKSVRFLARVAIRIPLLKKVMSKYYYLAKKL